MNLLPETAKASIKNGLRMRFLVMLSLLLALAFLVSTISLVPAFVLAKTKLLEQNLSSASVDPDRDAETQRLLAIPQEIGFKADVFVQNVTRYKTAEMLSIALGDLPTGVIINSISITEGRAGGDGSKQVRLSGTARDRQSLLDFSEQLKSKSFIAGVEVPVSSLTRERNLPFVMSVSFVAPK